MRAMMMLLATALAACGDDLADGTVTVRIYGEDFIEESIPADTFVDGWSVTFDQFLVSLGDISGSADHDDATFAAPSFQVYDLAQSSGGNGVEVATLAAPGGVYDHFGYVIAPDASGTSIRVVGTATKGDQTRTFDWAFSPRVTHSHCDIEEEIDSDQATVEITIHGDHLFYDDAVSEEPRVAFQLIADADRDGDGAVTLDELAATDITTQEHYGVGSLDIRDLRAFVTHQVGTVGHINGEGHCGSVVE